MSYFTDNQELILKFAENGIWGSSCCFEQYAQGIGFLNKKKEIIASVVYHNYNDTHNTIEISCYSASYEWFTKNNINLIALFPFQQLCVRLVKAVFTDNKSERLFKALSASLHYIPDLQKDGEKTIIAVLKRDNFLNSKFCNKETKWAVQHLSQQTQ